MLKHACVYHTYAHEQEAHEDSADGVEVDLELAEGWVDDKIEKWDEDDQGDGIEVL